MCSRTQIYTTTTRITYTSSLRRADADANSIIPAMPLSKFNTPFRMPHCVIFSCAETLSANMRGVRLCVSAREWMSAR